MTRALPLFALCVALTVPMTACTSTVQGVAVKPASSVPADDVPPLDESALDGLMLSNNALNRISGVELESLYDSDEMNDNADLVSDVECLGAIYPGEDSVYDGVDWTAVRDELLVEASSEDDGRLVEQTIVLFDTPDDAADFFDSSKATWRECARVKDIEVDDGAWVPDEVEEVDGRSIALKADVSGTLDGICQHALGVVSNVIAEGFSCDAADHDDAARITSQILDDASEQ
jgi:hypothetical protein